VLNFFVYLYLNSVFLSVRLSGTVGFFVVFTSFYSVFVLVLHYVLPEWRNKQLIYSLFLTFHVKLSFSYCIVSYRMQCVKADVNMKV